MKDLLIDGDILLYQYGCTNEDSIEWEEGVVSEMTNFESAKSELDSFLVSLMLTLNSQKLLIAFSSIDPPSFRYKILPTYKHNRKDKTKPKLYYQLRDYMINNYPCKIRPELEGDDVIGIEATTFPDKYIICSTDKDMKQIPGEHYNWRTKKRFKVSHHEAYKWFYTQVLTGDTVDGYSGCPGIGPKKAYIALTSSFEKIVTDVGLEPTFDYEKFYWSVIVRLYAYKSLTESDALVQARVARILRKEDYDNEREEIKLWTPEAY